MLLNPPRTCLPICVGFFPRLGMSCFYKCFVFRVVEFRLYLLNDSTNIFEILGAARRGMGRPGGIIKYVPHRSGSGDISAADFPLLK